MNLDRLPVGAIDDYALTQRLAQGDGSPVPDAVNHAFTCEKARDGHGVIAFLDMDVESTTFRTGMVKGEPQATVRRRLDPGELSRTSTYLTASYYQQSEEDKVANDSQMPPPPGWTLKAGRWFLPLWDPGF